MTSWDVVHISARPTLLQQSLSESDEEDVAACVQGVSTTRSLDYPQDQNAAPLHLPGEIYCSSGVKRLPLWHERWPAAELAKARDRNLRSFQRAYGQRPIADHEFVFSAGA